MCFKSDESKNMVTVNEEGHHTRLDSWSAELRKPEKLPDVIVIVGAHLYDAHKTVLSCYSRYFQELLLADSNSSVIHLELPISNEAFAVLLQFMYTSSLLITCQNIIEVFAAAYKLKIEKAVIICRKILNGAIKQEVHSVYTYVAAKQLGLKDAWTRALRSMCNRFEQIVGTEEYQDLKHDQVMELLRQDTLATRSEVHVYLAALKWISVRYLEREQFAVDVLGCVRFPLMTLHEILACHTPPLLPGITKIPEIKEMLSNACCFIAATTFNEEERFQTYNCAPRTYLLERETSIPWEKEEDRNEGEIGEFGQTLGTELSTGYIPEVSSDLNVFARTGRNELKLTGREGRDGRNGCENGAFNESTEAEPRAKRTCRDSSCKEEHKGKGDGINPEHRVFGQTIERISFASINPDALAGTVKNVPIEGEKENLSSYLVGGKSKMFWIR